MWCLFKKFDRYLQRYVVFLHESTFKGILFILEEYYMHLGVWIRVANMSINIRENSFILIIRFLWISFMCKFSEIDFCEGSHVCASVLTALLFLNGFGRKKWSANRPTCLLYPDSSNINI